MTVQSRQLVQRIIRARPVRWLIWIPFAVAGALHGAGELGVWPRRVIAPFLALGLIGLVVEWIQGMRGAWREFRRELQDGRTPSDG